MVIKNYLFVDFLFINNGNEIKKKINWHLFPES